MNKKLLALLTLAAISQVSLAQKTFSVKITNPTKEIRKEQPVVLKLDKETDVQSAVVTLAGKEIPSQLDDLDRDGTFDELCFLTDLDKRQILEYKIYLYDTGEPRVYPSRVFAEILLRNPKIKQKNAHDFYLNEISVPKNLKESSVIFAIHITFTIRNSRMVLWIRCGYPTKSTLPSLSRKG